MILKHLILEELGSSGELEQTFFSIRHGKPLAASLPSSSTNRMLAGELRRRNSEQISNRRVIVLAGSAPGPPPRDLMALMARGGIDPCWVRTEALVSGEPRRALLLSRDQLQALRVRGEIEAIELPNGQTARALVEDRTTATTAWPPPLCVQPLVLAEMVLGQPEGNRTMALQAVPSSRYAASVPSNNAFYAVVNRRHRWLFESGLVAVSNPWLEEDHPDLAAHFGVPVHYSSDVAVEEVALDDVVLLAIGARLGEPCQLERLPRAGPREALNRRVFSFRHSVCRVTSAATVDQEQPVLRLPQAVFDIIGVAPGQKVVVESLQRGRDGERRRARMRVRALLMHPVERDEEAHDVDVRLRTSIRYLEVVGSIDLPSCAMDKVRREAVGASLGSAVYIRPSLTAVASTELSALTLLLAAGVVGSLSAENVPLSIVFGALAVVFVVIRGLARLR